MIFEEREYQINCVNAWIDSFKNEENNPVVALPTGAGKSVVLAKFCQKWFDLHENSRILILSHTKEIVKQDYEKLLSFFPKFGVGVYSAGLGMREIKKITLGTVGSVYRKIDLFKKFDLCIIDEVHAVSHKNTGMYRKIFQEIGCRVTGMSATVFRTGHGYIFEENKEKNSDIIFNHLAYDLTDFKSFTKLVDDGYLCNLLPRATKFELNSEGIKVSGGDYNIKDLSEKHDRIENTRKAVKELCLYRKNYKKWLIFCIDTKHADNVTKELINNGISSYVLHSKMSYDRDKTIEKFKNGEVQALVSVGMVTTGFDVPDIDLIGMLRPTKSPVLHVQMIGRGLRVHENKKHCVVLDFAGNVERLGPINDIQINNEKSKKGIKRIMAKKCANCRALNHLAAKRCVACGAIFPIKRKKKALKEKAGKDQIIKRYDDQWVKVDYITYQIHQKSGRPDSLRVNYRVGKKTISHFVFLDHSGYAKYLSNLWVEKMDPTCTIFTVEHVFLRRDKLKKPTHIKIRKDGRFYKIMDYKFEGDYV